jgi:hypothetical protein
MLRKLMMSCALLAATTAGIAADVTYRKDIQAVW